MVHWNFEKSHTFIEPWDEDTLTAQTFFSLNPSASHLWNRLAPMTCEVDKAMQKTCAVTECLQVCFCILTRQENHLAHHGD